MRASVFAMVCSGVCVCVCVCVWVCGRCACVGEDHGGFVFMVDGLWVGRWMDGLGTGGWCVYRNDVVWCIVYFYCCSWFVQLCTHLDTRIRV
jgi:hypothetical protein